MGGAGTIPLRPYLPPFSSFQHWPYREWALRSITSAKVWQRCICSQTFWNSNTFAPKIFQIFVWHLTRISKENSVWCLPNFWYLITGGRTMKIDVCIQVTPKCVKKLDFSQIGVVDNGFSSCWETSLKSIVCCLTLKPQKHFEKFCTAWFLTQSPTK